MQAPQQSSGSDLRTSLTRAHDEADRLLADPQGNRLEVVTWLSGHIAAFEHAVYPAVKRKLPDGPELVARDRAIVARLARLLRILERRHSGDSIGTGMTDDGMSRRLENLVAEHREVQRDILDGLERALDAAALDKLTRGYEDALAHAPTRPHPHLRSGLLFRLDALRDRVLDTLDSRHVPIPRVPRTRIAPGRWGSYLLGQPQEPSAAHDRQRATE
jgi:hypothetical protein